MPQYKNMPCHITKNRNSGYDNLFLEGLKFGSAKYDLFIRLPIMYYLTGDKSKGMGFINNIRMNYPEDYLFTEKYISNFEKL